jgi:hypothetical protein
MFRAPVLRFAMSEKCGRSDLRPSRLDIDALLSSTSVPVEIRRAVVDALEDGGLLRGSEPPPGAWLDAYGRLPKTQFDQILSGYDEPTRKQVTSVLSQVGALVS